MDGLTPHAADPSALRIAVIGAVGPGDREVARRSSLLARHLQAAGHHVVLVSWASTDSSGGKSGGSPRSWRHWARYRGRLDSWVRAGRRLRHVDSIVVVGGAATATMPAQLAALRAAGALAGRAGPRPQAIVLAPPARARSGTGLLPALLRRADATLVADQDQARRAREAGARRVCVAELPRHSALDRGRRLELDLDGAWAHCLGLIEALSVDLSLLGHPNRRPESSAPSTGHHRTVDRTLPNGRPGTTARSTGHQPTVDRTIPNGRPGTNARSTGHSSAPTAQIAALGTRVAARIRQHPVVSGAVEAGRGARSRSRIRRPLVALRPADLPEWVRPTDVLVDPADAAAAQRLARYLGLPRTLDRVAAWAALGTLAAILRIRDDGLRSAVVIDEGGARSTLSRWARAVGFAPVEIDFTGAQPSVPTFDVDAGSLDVLVRIDPHGCDANDVDQVLEQASWALRPGGLLVITLPLGPPGADGAVGPADVRAITARADDAGFALVGDLDGELTARMRDADRHTAPTASAPTPNESTRLGPAPPTGAASKAPRTRRQRRAGGDSAAYGLVRLVLRRR
jgi:hypothetical protein